MPNSYKMNTRILTPNFKDPRIFRSGNPLKSLDSTAIVQKGPDPLAGALAHEVRNPLTTINLAVQLLKSPTKVHDNKFYLDIILDASNQINDLINNLLKSCQPDEMQLEKYSIHELLDEALALTENRVLLKNITVRKEYTTLDCKILVNKQKIRIALTNLIINAIEAMHSAQGKLTLITKSINGRCVIIVKDNGIGISKENLKNIFTPYFTDKAGGMGLGLSTTMDILNSNHAIAEVQSEVGKGTRFIISFEKIKHPGE